ncbi:MAG TPA: amidohydrolase family protein, partial [Blastocatellia bacterium]|nr:amidohydrolase family protein [Blastocatellia bacterium]
PRLYVASPALNGQNVKTPEDGARLVREYKAAGYDLLKIHEGLSQEAYEKIIVTAFENGMKYAGHVPDSVSVYGALKARQMTIEHLDNYLVALEADDSPIRKADPQRRARQLPFHMDEKKIPALVRAIRKTGTWSVPTMVLYQNVFSSETGEALAARPEMKYTHPQVLNNWIKARNNQLKNNDPAAGRRILELRNKMLKALFDAGAKIMLGSDAPQFFNVPGFSVHREMKAMVDAGLTPFQVLECATRKVAIHLNKLNYFGTVEEGKTSDLILLEANPLKDISNTSRIAGVMIGDRWLPKSELRKMLDEIAAMYQNAKS